MLEGRSGRTHVNLCCSSCPKQIYDSSAGGTPYYGIINHYYTLALHYRRNRIQFYAHLHFSLTLGGLYKCSSNVFIFYESDFKRNAGSLGISNGCVKSAVRNSDDHICIHGMFLCKKLAGLYPGIMYTGSVNVRIRTGKVKIFKDTVMAGTFTYMGFIRAYALLIYYNDFTGFYVSYKCCPD